MTTPARQIRLLFAGGGTGGHLFPALAIANRITELVADKKALTIEFVGTRRGIEFRLRDTLGYPLRLIRMRGIARSLTLKNLLVPFAMLAGLFRSWMLIGSFKPHMVVGTGGYVCWPLLKCAVWRKVPIVLQEQNSFPGVVIRQLAGSADKIYLGFAGAAKHLPPQARIKVTGNPVRPDLKLIPREDAANVFGLDPDKKTILVLGGSQGAQAINTSILRSLSIDALPIGYQLLWQTGKRNYKDVSVEAGDKVSTKALFPFANNMDEVYSAADFVIARAGALTIAEILQYKLPSMLIPYPYAAGDHQKKNAEELSGQGMTIIVEESRLSEKDVLQDAIRIIESDTYASMKSKIDNYKKDEASAVDMIAEDILNQLDFMTVNE